jgi:hypothetical protein
VTRIEKSSPRKPGRPRKFGPGRRNVMVRFTPDRYVELRAEADLHGRSLSEQVEHMVEQTRLLRELVGQLKISYNSAHEDGVRLRSELAEIKATYAAELSALRVLAALEPDRLAEIVEAGVARALAKRG